MVRDSLSERIKGVEAEERQRIKEAVFRESEEVDQDQTELNESPDRGLCRRYGAAGKRPDPRASDLTVDILVDDIVPGAEHATQEEAKEEKLHIGDAHAEYIDFMA